MRDNVEAESPEDYLPMSSKLSCSDLVEDLCKLE
jgi:hypothetical protein